MSDINNENLYRAYQSKVEFVPREELPALSLNDLKEYRLELKLVIEIIETDLEWKDESQEWRQQAISALKSHKIALIYAQNEIDNRRGG